MMEREGVKTKITISRYCGEDLALTSKGKLFGVYLVLVKKEDLMN